MTEFDKIFEAWFDEQKQLDPNPGNQKPLTKDEYKKFAEELKQNHNQPIPMSNMVMPSHFAAFVEENKKKEVEEDKDALDIWSVEL